MFVRQVQGRKLIDATFKRRDKNGRYDVVIQAREAELEVDLPNNRLVVHMRYGEACHEAGTYVSFLYRKEAVELPTRFIGQHQSRPRDMTWKQLHQARQNHTKLIAEIDEELDQAEAGRLSNHTPDNLPRHVDNLKERRRFYSQEIRLIDTEFQMRPALSLGCLCFVFIGCPVGIWFSRSDYLSAFITCFLPIVFLYYPLLLCFSNLAKDNHKYSEFLIWASDILVVLIGLPLYRQLLRH